MYVLTKFDCHLYNQDCFRSALGSPFQQTISKGMAWNPDIRSGSHLIHKVLLFNLEEADKVHLIKDKTMELLKNVPGAKNVTFRSAIEVGDLRYQYLITVDFESMQDHEQYLVHEKHVEFSKQHFRPYISDLLIQFFE